MKTTVAPYSTTAWCVRIECVNGTIIRLTTYPLNLTMSNSQVYETDSGYDASAYTSNTTMASSAIDLEGIVGFGGITRDQISSGVFDSARVYIFKCNYLNPVEDYEPITSGFFGKTTLEDDHYKIEGMSLIDALNQSVGNTYTAACSNSFGDEGCGITLSLVDVTGSVTSINNSNSIRDSLRTEVIDWFGAGTIQFTSGNNMGLKPLEIRSYTADGTIITFDPFYYLPQIGDTFVLVPGCRKRLEDCRDKWANVAVSNGVHTLKQFPNKGGFFGFSMCMPTASVYNQVGGRV